MVVELKIMQMSTVRRATMATTGTKIRRKEAQLPWMTRTRIPTPGSPLRTHMQDNQLRILMLGSQQQKTRIMQGKQLRILTMQRKILTTPQRILTQGVNPRSLMTLTEKKMIEAVKRKQLREEP